MRILASSGRQTGFYSQRRRIPLPICSSSWAIRSSVLSCCLLFLSLPVVVVESFATYLLSKSNCWTELSTDEVIMNHPVVALDESDDSEMHIQPILNNDHQIWMYHAEQHRLELLMTVEYPLEIELQVRTTNPDTDPDYQYALDIVPKEEEEDEDKPLGASFVQGSCEASVRVAGRNKDTHTLTVQAEAASSFSLVAGWATGHEAVRLTPPLTIVMSPVGADNAGAEEDINRNNNKNAEDNPETGPERGLDEEAEAVVKEEDNKNSNPETGPERGLDKDEEAATANDDKKDNRKVKKKDKRKDRKNGKLELDVLKDPQKLVDLKVLGDHPIREQIARHRNQKGGHRAQPKDAQQEPEKSNPGDLLHHHHQKRKQSNSNPSQKFKDRQHHNRFRKAAQYQPPLQHWWNYEIGFAVAGMSPSSYIQGCLVLIVATLCSIQACRYYSRVPFGKGRLDL